MTEITERLVRFAGKVCLSTDAEIEAAIEIERLRAENEAVWKECEDQNNSRCEMLRKISSLRAENEKLRAALKRDYGGVMDRLEEQVIEIENLWAENEKLRAALKRWEDTGLQKDWPVTYDAALKETE